MVDINKLYVWTFQNISDMKIYLIIIIQLIYFNMSFGQLFYLNEDTICRNTSISPGFIQKGLKSYTWKSSTGLQDTLPDGQNIKFTQTGVQWVSIEVKTKEGSISYDSLQLLQHEGYFSITDPDPDIYYRIKDQSGDYIYTSRSYSDMEVPGFIKGKVILHPDESYLFEFWDFDIFDGDDFLGSIFVINPQGDQIYTWGDVKISLSCQPALPTYADTLFVFVADPVIIQKDNDLYMTLAGQIPTSGSVLWKNGPNFVTSTINPQPFSPEEEACYSGHLTIANVCQFIESAPYCFIKTGIKTELTEKITGQSLFLKQDNILFPEYKGDYYLYSLSGQLIKQGNAAIDIANIPAGHYILIVKENEQLVSQLVTIIN